MDDETGYAPRRAYESDLHPVLLLEADGGFATVTYGQLQRLTFQSHAPMFRPWQRKSSQCGAGRASGQTPRVARPPPGGRTIRIAVEARSLSDDLHASMDRAPLEKLQEDRRPTRVL